jgi:hypothetical protein
MEQVRALDPDFMTRLEQHLRQGHECFAGPVLAGSRNTNNAWIESRLAWTVLDDEVWAKIRGSSPRFDYQLSGGDDAKGVHHYRYDQDLIMNAVASHGPMMAFIAASFLLKEQAEGRAVAPSILAQLESVADFLMRTKLDPLPPALGQTPGGPVFGGG